MKIAKALRPLCFDASRYPMGAIITMDDRTFEKFNDSHAVEDVTERMIFNRGRVPYENFLHVLVMANGPGIGDFLYVTPLLSAIKRRSPLCKITVSVNPRHQSFVVFRNNPNVDTLHTDPDRIDIRPCSGLIGESGAVDYFVYIDVVITNPALERHDNCYDIAFRAAGIEDAQEWEKKPEIYLDPKDEAWGRAQVNPNEINISIQSGSRDPKRTMHISQFDWMSHQLLQIPGVHLHHVGTIDTEYRSIEYGPNLTNWVGQTPQTKKFISLIRAMDLVIAPDTATVHIAACWDIQTIAFFTDWVKPHTRIRTYPACQAFPFMSGEMAAMDRAREIIEEVRLGKRNRGAEAVSSHSVF
jgi:hypothetical protein